MKTLYRLFRRLFRIKSEYSPARQVLVEEIEIRLISEQEGGLPNHFLVPYNREYLNISKVFLNDVQVNVRIVAEFTGNKETYTGIVIE